MRKTTIGGDGRQFRLKRTQSAHPGAAWRDYAIPRWLRDAAAEAAKHRVAADGPHDAEPGAMDYEPGRLVDLGLNIPMPPGATPPRRDRGQR